MENEKKESSKQQQPPTTSASQPIIKDDSDKIKEKDTKAGNKTEKGNNKCDVPQPFSVKIYKEKGMNTQEKISAFSFGLAFIAIIITALTFGKTREAVDIADKNLKHSLHKDSVAEEKSEVENRPIIEMANLIIGSIGTINIIKFNAINMGKFPALITSIQYGTLVSPLIDTNEINKMAMGKEITENEAVSSASIVPYTVQLLPILPVNYKLYKKGKLFIYFFGNITYTNLATKKKYLHKFAFELSGFPMYNFRTLTNDDILIP